jgi:hypothetical protein
VDPIEVALATVGSVEAAIAAWLLMRPAKASERQSRSARRVRDDEATHSVVVRLSETCSSCQWAVPALNALHERVTAQGAPDVSLVAEIFGDERMFVQEHGLTWPTRQVSPSAVSWRERLPNLTVFGAGAATVLRVEAEEFDQLEGLVAPLLGVPDATFREAAHPDLVADLSRMTQALQAFGHLNGHVAWLVNADLPEARAKGPAAATTIIAVTPRVARDLIVGRCDPAAALVHREMRVFGDLSAAVRVLTGAGAAVALVQRMHEHLPAPAPRDASLTRTVLAEVPPAEAAASCLRVTPPLQRRLVLRSLWDYARAGSEDTSGRVFDIFSDLALSK